jgi:hypothetical protein
MTPRGRCCTIGHMRQSRPVRGTVIALVAAVASLVIGGCSDADDHQQASINTVEQVQGPKGWVEGPTMPACAQLTDSCTDPTSTKLWYAPPALTEAQACAVALRWVERAAVDPALADCTQWLRTHPNVNPRKWGGVWRLDAHHWVSSTANLGAAALGSLFSVGVRY